MRVHFLMVSALSSTLAFAGFAVADPSAAPATSTTPAAPTAPAASSTPAPATAKGPSPYNAKIQKGHAAYLAHDFDGAIAAYKEAIAADSADPYAYYFLGEAQVASGNNGAADGTFAEGLSKVGAKDDIHAKLLFVTADLRERSGNWAEAKTAWEDYGQFVAAHPNAKGYAATATERAKMVATHVDFATKYAAVKQRIEQRTKETTAPAPDDGPQGPTKKK